MSLLSLFSLLVSPGAVSWLKAHIFVFLVAVYGMLLLVEQSWVSVSFDIASQF